MRENTFILDYTEIRRSLPVKVTIKNFRTQEQLLVNALFDTGAFGTVITKDVYNKLMLPYVDSVLTYGVNSKSVGILTCATIILPNNIVFDNTDIITCDSLVGADMLLGMDLITQGDFLLTNNHSTVLKFLVPSMTV